MSEKTIKSRIIHKHAVESDWLKATNFIPLQGEIIVYDIDKNHDYERMKIGDGETVVSSLPFINETLDSSLSDLVGDTPVAEQIEAAVTPITNITYQDSNGDINIDRNHTDYMNSQLKITGDDIIFTENSYNQYDFYRC